MYLEDTGEKSRSRKYVGIYAKNKIIGNVKLLLSQAIQKWNLNIYISPIKLPRRQHHSKPKKPEIVRKCRHVFWLQYTNIYTNIVNQQAICHTHEARLHRTLCTPNI